MIFENHNQIDIAIRDQTKRYEIPREYPFPFETKTPKVTKHVDLDFVYNIMIQPFGIQLRRSSTNELFFDTGYMNFIFADRFIQLSMNIDPQTKIFGLGQRDGLFELKPGKYVLWAKDYQEDPELGPDNERPMYGMHPMILGRERSGNYYIVFFRNSNANEFIFQHDVLTYMTVRL
jgi:alpha-glucosidase (family GH31 glycosyl hydrolase)